MKVIDLLNKIANGEEIPKKIKVSSGIIFEYDGIDYKNKDYNKYFFDSYMQITEKDMNMEVEIIEDIPKEDKKIEKLNIEIQDERTGNAYIRNEYGTKCYLTKRSKIIANKINEIIDKINGEENEKNNDTNNL